MTETAHLASYLVYSMNQILRDIYWANLSWRFVQIPLAHLIPRCFLNIKTIRRHYFFLPLLNPPVYLLISACQKIAQLENGKLRLLSIVLNNLIATTTNHRSMNCSHLKPVEDIFYLLAVMHYPFHILSQRWQHSQKSIVNPLSPGSITTCAEGSCVCMHCWVWGTLSTVYNFRDIKWDSFLRQMNSWKIRRDTSPTDISWACLGTCLLHISKRDSKW